MEQQVKDTVLSIIRKDKKYKFALEHWKQSNHDSWNILDVWQCIYDAANGNEKEMINIIEHLTKKRKVFGRTQVYADQPHSMDMVRDENGVLQLVGYNPEATLNQPGQRGHDNTRIFKKSDGQVNKNFQRTDATLKDVGAILRQTYPSASMVDLTQMLRSIRDYASQKKLNTRSVANRIAKGRLKFDDNYKIIPFNAVVGESRQSRVIMITEEKARELKDKIEMSEYKFFSNVKQFLHDLLVDPVNAQVPSLLSFYGINRSKLLYYLTKEEAVIKSQKINDKDENNEPKTATMKVKYKVPKKNLDRKLKRIFIKLFEKNVPLSERTMNEEGEGGCCDAAGTFGMSDSGGYGIEGNSAVNSGQYDTKFSDVIRRTSVKEDTTTSTVGDYQYDAPFPGDEESLKRGDGIGGSTSVQRV